MSSTSNRNPVKKLRFLRQSVKEKNRIEITQIAKPSPVSSYEIQRLPKHTTVNTNSDPPKKSTIESAEPDLSSTKQSPEESVTTKDEVPSSVSVTSHQDNSNINRNADIEDIYPWLKLLPEQRSSSVLSAELDEDYLAEQRRNDDKEEEEESREGRTEVGEEGAEDVSDNQEGDDVTVIEEDEVLGQRSVVITARGLVPTNIDQRGRIRGACNLCDCDEFERATKGAFCFYCSCPPSEHDLLWPPPTTQFQQTKILPSQKQTSDGAVQITDASNDNTTNDEKVTSGEEVDTTGVQDATTQAVPLPKPRLFELLKVKFDRKKIEYQLLDNTEVTEEKQEEAKSEKGSAESDSSSTSEPSRTGTPSSKLSFATCFRTKIQEDEKDDKPITPEYLERQKRKQLRKIRKEMEKEIKEFEKARMRDFEKLKEIWSESHFRELPLERVDTDMRGILRGRCRDCDCEGFESDQPSSSRCAYCSCAPSYHIAKVDYFTQQPLQVFNNRYVNAQAIKRWKKRELGADPETDWVHETPQSSRRVSIAPTVDVPSVTEYENRAVLDAIENDEEYVMTQIDEEETVASYDEKVERKKLREAEKAKATVADIYPWIEQEAEPKRKVTTLAQLVKESKRKGLSQRHNLIIDLTEEIRQLRAEVEDILFYDKIKRMTLRNKVYYLYMKHYDLVDMFNAFADEIEVFSRISEDSFFYDPPTPTHVKVHRSIRKFEFYIKRFLNRPCVDEKAINEKYRDPTLKDSRFIF